MKNIAVQIVFVIIACLFCANTIKGQVVIQGTVVDNRSHPITSATVYFLNTTIAGSTDSTGFFSFSGLYPGRYTVEITAIGYAAIAKNVNVGKENILLPPIHLGNVLNELGTVIVTANKKEEALQHIPASVTALTAQQVKDYRLWDTKELTAIVPDLYAGDPGDGRNVTSIRGITTTSYDPAVATYIDGVNQFSLDTYIPQLWDIERIEVLRGPQGTLYGRNAMGGVINIITKPPTNTVSGFAEVNVGNYGQQRFTAAVRFPVIKNKLFAGFSGFFNKRNGYYNNEFTKTAFDNQQQASGNFYLKYLPATGWNITLNAKKLANRNNGPFPIVNGIAEAFAKPFTLNQNAVGKMIDNTLNASLVVTHWGHLASFTWQTAWQNNYRYYNAPIDGDFSPLDAVSIINDYGSRWNNVKVLTSELRFDSAQTKLSKFQWTAGAYFFRQASPNKQATHFGQDAGMLGIPATDFSTINTTTGLNAGVAGYAQVNYQITVQLSMITGIRFDYEHKKLETLGAYEADGQPPVITRSDTAGTVSFSALSPKLGLQYVLTDNNNLYVSYSRGFRTGGLTQLSGDPSQPPLYPYQPEYSNSIELGSKNIWLNNRLTLNAVVFMTFINNGQVPALVLPDAITVTKNTGRMVSKGAEIEVSGHLAKGLELNYSLGYTNAKYTAANLSSNGQVIDLRGRKQLFTPGTTSLLAAQYRYPLQQKKSTQLLARIEWHYLGKEYFDFANSISQNSYGIAHAKAGISGKHLELYGWIRNAFNKKHIEYAYDFGAVHLAVPRTYGVTVATTL